MAEAETIPPVAVQPVTFEAALAELERLVQAMEAGQLPLDDLLERYRRGADLLAFCRTRLQAVEAQVQVIDTQPVSTWTEAQ